MSIDPLLHAGRADVRELQERRRVGLRVGRRQDLDRALQLGDEHAAVGQELIAVGRSKPVARTSFWKELALATLTVHRRRERRVARRVAGSRRQRVRAVRDRARVPRERVRRGGVLDAGVDAVDEELHAGDADVVARVGRHGDDVAHLGVVRGRGDRHRRRLSGRRRRRRPAACSCPPGSRPAVSAGCRCGRRRSGR